MNDLKISTKLFGGFGVMGVLLMLIVAIGLHHLSSVNDNVKDIISDKVPATQLSTETLRQVDVIAIALRNMMLNHDNVDQQKQLDTIENARQLIQNSTEKLAKITLSNEGKELLHQVSETGKKYANGTTALLKLITSGKEDESKVFLANELRPILAVYKDATNKLIQFQFAAIAKKGEQSESTYVESRVLLIGLGMIAIFLATIVGVLITRNLMSALGGEPKEALDMVKAVAEGDLSIQIAVKPGDQTSIIANLQTMQTSLLKVVSDVRLGSESVATASAEIAQGNMDLSARTESQASALEETAASMEELMSTVKQNADNAKQANQLARSASLVASQGGAVVTQAVGTMREISESSVKIADIISVIDGIAFQTNILALNAAVEAARAGEQGRGFAVVASEVRSLAGRSAEAAKEIKSLINTSVNCVRNGTELVDQAGVTMIEIVNSIKRVEDIMSEISASSHEQALGVTQVGEAVTHMDESTQQNAALVEEMAAAASTLKFQATELVQTVSVFKMISGADDVKRNANNKDSKHINFRSERDLVLLS
ncbi:MCP four helix bundle domain-containing protein [Undibacterium amnicola]|uniref:MCP four helix bundle domain-containing protein n=1 Tax=Undibacterium amnicola TaxID=1834038 RepID=A0ABR6XNL9_9BURK|nr:methyl-accepting chemotaxis protein [Undibacterium amnicola]MBC3830604.1 MCP four helix bundle domain-containing protein [Undibacterium amnicola]